MQLRLQGRRQGRNRKGEPGGARGKDRSVLMRRREFLSTGGEELKKGKKVAVRRSV
jgi:hypothetical protein